ncbi:hypothetical protein PCA31118_04822 [Pandoraea captiosa]|uniref:Excisionase n=1 Tax=Pandoraea captiosa TaxID=2508302 RepID=A0A5E5AQA9_9BURK|nr:excisionase [Pandoraea captiosa]VVE74703.1 hypothetical protein PCA31118_04822 [Pandoraea captiosa]
MKWVKLKKYCELSGDTPDAVHAKRRKGQFVDGVHCRIADDGNLWINIEAVERWVEQGARATIGALRGA